MPTEHLPFSGFENIQPATAEKELFPSNSLSAYRIHEPDPVVFTESFAFRWIASSDNAHKNGGLCNYNWPAAEMPAKPSPIVPNPAEGDGDVTVDALAWVYIWPEVDAA